MFVLHTGVGSAQENVHKKPGPEVLPWAHSREESTGRDVVCVRWQVGGRPGPTAGLLELAVLTRLFTCEPRVRLGPCLVHMLTITRVDHLAQSPRSVATVINSVTCIVAMGTPSRWPLHCKCQTLLLEVWFCLCLTAGQQTFSRKGQSEYFRLCKPYDLCCNYSAVLVAQKQPGPTCK